MSQEILTSSSTIGLTTLASQLVANSSDLAVATAYMTSTQPPPPDQLPSNGLHGLPCFKDLIAVLFECFSIMTLGYLSGRFKLISPEAKDLGTYLTTFALPMIIFLNIAQMEFNTINLSYLFCMLASKLLLFSVVTILTLIISYPTNFGYAGALSILATQSNDFALGYPLIKSLYGETMPEMLSYLSLMAPIQLLILNPLGIGLLEFQKHKQRSANKTTSQSASSVTCDKSIIGDSPETMNQCKFCQAKKHEPQEQNNADKIGAKEIRDHNSNMQTSVMKSESNHSAISSMIDPSGDCRLMRSSSASTTTGSCSVFGSQNVIYRLKGSTDINTDHSSIDSSSGVKANNDNTHQVICTNVDEYTKRRSVLLNNRTCNDMRSTTSLTFPSKSNESWNPTDIDYGFGNVRILTQIDESISDDLSNICCNSEIISSQNESLDPSYMTHPPSSSTSQSPFKQNNRDIRVRLLDRQFVPASGLILSAAGQTAQSSERQPSCSSAYHGCTCNKPEQHRDGNIGSPVIRSYAIDWTFLTAFATNPLIIASVVALAVNLIYGPELPRFVTKVSNTIAASFAAPALFVVGLSMYGKFELLLKNPNDLLLASVLVLTKIILLSSLMRTITTVVLPYYVQPPDLPYLIDFSYLYGLLPTAPTVCIIAKRYNVLVNVVSISMMLSTFLSAPLMLSSSAIINQGSSINVQMVNDIIAQTIRVSSLVTLFSSVLTLCALWLAYLMYEKARRLRSTEILCATMKRLECQSTRSLLILLASIQLIIGMSGLFKMLILGDTHQEGIATGKHIMTKAHAIHPVPESAETDSFDLNGTARTIQITDTNFFAMHTDFNSYICSLQYVSISTGLSLSRVAVLSLAVATYVRSFFDQAKASKVSALSLKVCVLVAIFLIIWYSRDARDAKCLPQAALMPSSLWSLRMRLLIDCVFLLVTIPILSLLFRKENKRNYILVNDQDLSSLPGHCIVTSSASLNSDACSAMTAQTNLDLSAPVHVATGDNTGESSRALNESPCVEWKFVETANQSSCDGTRDTTMDQEFHSVNHSYHTPINIYTSSSGSEDEKPPDPRNVRNQVGEQTIVFKPDNRTTFSEYSPPIVLQLNNQSLDHKQQGDSTASARKSVLMVFMLVSSMLSISAMIQTLLQDKPFGTFRQQEILSSTIEFGQGLTTFLLYGVRMFSKNGS